MTKAHDRNRPQAARRKKSHARLCTKKAAVIKQAAVRSNGRVCVSKNDFERLLETIAIARRLGGGKDIILGKLRRKLQQAEVLPPEKMPKDTVTMNSAGKILWLDTREVRLFWLGFPAAINHDGNKVSILSSLGIALLGTKVGSAMAQEVPAGHRFFKVLKLLYQPEAAQDYHL